MSKKKIILTGDRPTGCLHLGHFVGTLKSRLELQDVYESYIMIADAQAITDNVSDIDKVKNSILEVACDYMAVGLDPKKCTIFIQSCIPQISELFLYLLNMVTLERIANNPTLKYEKSVRSFKQGIPAGFSLYPMAQVADITAFEADLVPVGLDQAPMVELTKDVVRKFNQTYQTDALVVPEAIFPKKNLTLQGIDGRKMSKTFNNAIFLSDADDEIAKKVKKIKSDPSRLSVSDPGDPEKAIVFSYLEVFDEDKVFLEDLKRRYIAGGLSDKLVKDRLTDVLVDFIAPIRERRGRYIRDPGYIFDVLSDGNNKAETKASLTINNVKEAMGIVYEGIWSK